MNSVSLINKQLVIPIKMEVNFAKKKLHKQTFTIKDIAEYSLMNLGRYNQRQILKTITGTAHKFMTSNCLPYLNII